MPCFGKGGKLDVLTDATEILFSGILTCLTFTDNLKLTKDSSSDTPIRKYNLEVKMRDEA
jgi:hypothetical protein